MRIFLNCKEAIREIERDLWEMGIDVTTQSMQDKAGEFKTKELQGYSYRIINPNDKDSVLEYMKLNKTWAEADLLERLHGVDNPGMAWTLRKEVWEQFMEDGRFYYTYGERMHESLQTSIDTLKKDPSSRQAIIPIYDRQLDTGNQLGKHRIPCSVFYQLLYRQGKLDIYYFMRSTDFLTHFGYDMWHAISLMQYIAKETGLAPGSLVHFATSLHAYYSDMQARGIF